MSLTVLGSTGSIGRQTLEVAAFLKLPVAALAAHSSAALMERQARQLRPGLAVLYDEAAAKDLRVRLADTETRVLSGMGGLMEAVSLPEADTVLAAMSGAVGLRPALRAAEAGKKLALANKETLVCAGALVTGAVKRAGGLLLPVDSEHSAIFQCMQGRTRPRRLLLTASGGPFRGYTKEMLEHITPADALRHPNWTMGPKITVDSATLMNKGLEFVEAMWLFDMAPAEITVLVHPQSVVHSMVEFPDGAVLAQLGTPDMRLPIQLALTWPARVPGLPAALDLTKTPALTFEAPDVETFPCLKLAMSLAERAGENADLAVMNAANEVAVGAFLGGRIGFTQIYSVVAAVTERLSGLPGSTLEEIEAADAAARRLSQACLSSIS